MRTTIDLPAELLAEAKRCALNRGESLSTFVVDAVRHALRPSSVPALTAIDLPVWSSHGPAPSWDQLKAAMAEDDAAVYRDVVRAAEPRPTYDA